ncbi:hypothetical protein DFH09DRAFT_197151 [Mycena vulgaris]|nr:hypothetical protein DFH09DRAFT_197151 [Mycena vulgaris]
MIAVPRRVASCTRARILQLPTPCLEHRPTNATLESAHNPNFAHSQRVNTSCTHAASVYSRQAPAFLQSPPPRTSVLAVRPDQRLSAHGSVEGAASIPLSPPSQIRSYGWDHGLLCAHSLAQVPPAHSPGRVLAPSGTLGTPELSVFLCAERSRLVSCKIFSNATEVEDMEMDRLRERGNMYNQRMSIFLLDSMSCPTRALEGACGRRYGRLDDPFHGAVPNLPSGHPSSRRPHPNSRLRTVTVLGARALAPPAGCAARHLGNAHRHARRNKSSRRRCWPLGCG